jgi:hypothetical protein
MNSKIKSIALLALLSIPFLGVAVPHGQSNPNAASLDSEHQANMANIVNRNQDNVSADPTTTLPDWLKKITVSGVLDPFASLTLGKRPIPVPAPQQGSGGPSQAIGMNAATLYVDAQVANWVLVHTAFAYDTNFYDAGTYVSATGATQPQTLFIEEASVTLANFEQSPFWLTAGRQFLPFGSYKHNTLNRPLTQYLSEANNVALTLGAVHPVGEINLYGDVYTFQGLSPVNQNPVKQQIKGFGANVGLNKNNDTFGYNLNVGFINNMMNNYFVGFACNPLSPGINANSCNSGYIKKVPGVSVHFDINAGPFGLVGDYVTATTPFSGGDLPSGANPISTSSPGAKPWAYSLESTFNFASIIRNKTYDSRAFIGFQQSGDAVNISSATVLGGYWTPRYRYIAGYGIDLIKNVTVRFQYQYDVDYAKAQGGTGLNSTTLFTDLKVAF